MCPVIHSAKPYQLALLIKQSLDDIIDTQQSACEATLQYQYQNINVSLICAFIAESSIDTFKGNGHILVLPLVILLQTPQRDTTAL